MAEIRRMLEAGDVDEEIVNDESTDPESDNKEDLEGSEADCFDAVDEANSDDVVVKEETD